MWCVLLLVVAIVVEAASFVTYRILYDELPFDASSHLLAPEYYASQEATPKTSWIIHPYYGYLINPENFLRLAPPGARVRKFPNAHGFLSERPIPFTRRANEYVVWITGGSVASMTGVIGDQYLEEQLEEKCQALSGKDVTVINLGVGAYKQPQQLMVVNDLLAQGAQCDLIINLDGFNEAALPFVQGGLAHDTFPFFPQNWRPVVETQGSTARNIADGKAIALDFVRTKIYVLADGFRWVSSMQLACRVADFLVDKLKHHILNEAIAYPRNATARVSADGRAFLGPSPDYSDENRLRGDIARHWARSSLMMHALISEFGGEYYHFLQPNQYTGRKPYTEEELEKYITDRSPYAKYAILGYPFLRNASATLVQHGVHFSDLSDIFSDYHETAYCDDCCHLNVNATRFMIDTIVERICPFLRER